MVGISPIGKRTTTKRAVGLAETTVPGRLPPGVTIMPCWPAFLSREAHPATSKITNSLSHGEIIGMIRTANHRSAGDVHETHVAGDIAVSRKALRRDKLNHGQML